MGGFAIIPCAAEGFGVSGVQQGPLGEGGDRSLLLAPGACRVTRVGLSTCGSVGVGTGRGQVTLRSSRGHEHQRRWEGGRSEAGAQSRPWASTGSWEWGALPSGVPGGCWGLAAKRWRRRAVPQTSGCTGPHGSPPSPGTALGWGIKPLFLREQHGELCRCLEAFKGPSCPRGTDGTSALPASQVRVPGVPCPRQVMVRMGLEAPGDCGPIPVPIYGWESVPALPPGSPGWDQTGGWVQGCKVGKKVGNGAINGKAIRPFSSSPSSSSLRHLLSSSTSTSFLLSLSAPPLSPLKDFSLFLSG